MHGFNYGGILQAYATQSVLRSHGHEVTTLDYHPSRKAILLRRLTGNQAWIHRPLRRWQDRRKFSGVDAFERFREEHFHFSKPCYNASQLSRACAGMDIAAVGSDQVWSAAWLRPPYFLDFPLPAGTRRVSLAACCGHPSSQGGYRDYLRRTLGKFDALSVRNKFTADLVEEVLGKRPTIICDPTIAHDFGSFPSPSAEPYVLVYVINRLRPLGLAAELIGQIRQQTGCRVVSITPAELRGAESLPVDEVLTDISPLDWVAWIANSAAMVTDSFHGCVFAAKYQRQFVYADSSGETVGRISALLHELQLGHLQVQSAAGLDAAAGTAIDWERVAGKLADWRAGYHDFVRQLG